MAVIRFDPNEDGAMDRNRYGDYVLYQEYNTLEDRIAELETKLATVVDNLDAAEEDFKDAKATIAALRDENWKLAQEITEINN